MGQMYSAAIQPPGQLRSAACSASAQGRSTDHSGRCGSDRWGQRERQGSIPAWVRLFAAFRSLRQALASARKCLNFLVDAGRMPIFLIRPSPRWSPSCVGERASIAFCLIGDSDLTCSACRPVSPAPGVSPRRCRDRAAAAELESAKGRRCDSAPITCSTQALIKGTIIRPRRAKAKRRASWRADARRESWRRIGEGAEQSLNGRTGRDTPAAPPRCLRGHDLAVLA